MQQQSWLEWVGGSLLGKMDPDTTLEQLAMLSLEDKAAEDKEKEEEKKHDKEAPEGMPRTKTTWRRITRSDSETTDKQGKEYKQHEEEQKRYPLSTLGR